MEQMNKIELKGNVGNVRISNIGDNRVANFSLATNFLYKNREGEAVVETTWHNIVAWEGRNIPDVTRIKVGTSLYVCGRIRSNKIKSSDGASDKTFYEVIASKIAYEDPTPIQCGI